MALKRALSAPRVANAVDALELALSEIIYIPDQQEKQEILNRHTGRQVPDATVNMEQANPWSEDWILGKNNQHANWRGTLDH